MSERIYYSEDAKIQAKREVTALALMTLAVGVGIGSILALLFAPKEGDAIREDLTNAVEKRMGTVEKQVSEIREKFEGRIADLTS